MRVVLLIMAGGINGTGKLSLIYMADLEFLKNTGVLPIIG
jgi:predicted ABC-type ATPase